MAFDENDPALMTELAELGWGGDDSAGGGAGNVMAATAGPPAGHRPRPGPAPATGGGLAASAPPHRQQSGNELLRSLGLSLNSLGDQEVRGCTGLCGAQRLLSGLVQFIWVVFGISLHVTIP